jgi:homeobox protein cut-like
MVTAQRDRFKTKITELEGELQKSYQNIQSLRSEVASLQKDNLGLYEKSRYAASYNRSSSSAAYATSSNPTTIQIDGGGGGNSAGGLDRYRSAYEANISPFAAFRGRESQRAFKRMSLPERVVFQVTRLVLATRTSRNLFALYCLGLHLLVLVMLFNMGDGMHATVAAAGPVAAQAAAHHAAAAGGGKAEEWHEVGDPKG